MSWGRQLPSTQTDPFNYHTSLAYVRDFIEQATDASPATAIDYHTYSTVLNWCQTPDKLKVVCDTLASRLKLPSPASDKVSSSPADRHAPADIKAVILAQAIPLSSIGPLLDGLKAQMTNSHPYIAAIATQLHTSGDKLKAKTAEEAKIAAEQSKWDIWTDLYGKSKADWRGLPKEEDMGWGWWITQDVGAEEWWCVAKKDEGEGKK